MKLPRDKYILEEEFRALLNAALVRAHKNAQRDYTLLCLAGLAGLRVIEVTSLLVCDLRLRETRVRCGAEEVYGIIRVRSAKRKAKDGGPVYEEVFLPETARAALDRYVRSLPTKERQSWSRVFPLTTRACESLFKRYCALARLNPKYSFHALRHFRGLTVYEATKDIQLTREALRHAKIATTEIYVHTADLSRAAAVDPAAEMGGNDAGRERGIQDPAPDRGSAALASPLLPDVGEARSTDTDDARTPDGAGASAPTDHEAPA